MLTNGHPLATFTDAYDDLARLDQIDLPLMTERIWKGTAGDPDRERRRQAEFLVHGRVPWELVEEIGVMDGRVKQRVEEIFSQVQAQHRPKVMVRGGWYYRENR